MKLNIFNTGKKAGKWKYIEFFRKEKLIKSRFVSILIRNTPFHFRWKIVSILEKLFFIALFF